MQTDSATFSKSDRRMLGLGLDAWNNVMIASLAFGAFAAVVVGISTYAVIRLQKAQADAAAEDLTRYQLSTEKSISEANARAAEAQLALEKYKAPRSLSAEQLDRITAALSPFAGQEYALSVGAGDEPQALMCLISHALTSAKWKQIDPMGSITVDSPCGTVGVNTVSGINVRVTVNVTAADPIASAVSALLAALNAEGLAATGARDPKNVTIPTAMLIMVGVKP